jgi:hypothetical protein
MQKAPTIFWEDRDFVIQYTKKNYELLELVSQIERQNSSFDIVVPSYVMYLKTKDILLNFDDDQVKPELNLYVRDEEIMQLLLDTMYYWIPMSEDFILSKNALHFYEKREILILTALDYLDLNHFNEYVEKAIDKDFNIKIRYSIYHLLNHLKNSNQFLSFLKFIAAHPEYSKDILNYIRSLDSMLQEKIIKDNASFITSIKNDLSPFHPLNTFAWELLPHTKEYFSDETLEEKNNT